MAYNDFFGEIDNTLMVSSINCIELNLAGADPLPLYAVAAIQIALKVIHVAAYNDTGGAQAAATVAIETNIAAGGFNALTDAIPIAANDAITWATTMDPAQDTVGPADAMQANKNAAGDDGVVYLLFRLE